MMYPTVAELSSIISANINEVEALWAEADQIRDGARLMTPIRIAEILDEEAASIAVATRLLQMRRDGILRARRINLRERLAR